MNNYKACVVPAALMMGLASAAHALELDLGLGARTDYHSNILRTEHDAKSDVERAVILEPGLKQLTGPLTADMQYRATYLDYLHDVESDTTQVEGRSNIQWAMLPERFNWIINHQLTDRLTDTRLPDIAQNRERRSVLTGGFDWILALGKVDSLIVSPRYVDVSFQGNNGADSKRKQGTMIWEHDFSAVSRLQTSANYAKAEFDDSTNNYNNKSALISYLTELSRLTYQIGGGYNRIERDSGDNFDGYTARAGADYHADILTFGGSLVRQLTDTSIGLSGVELQVPNFESRDSNFDQPSIVERTQAEIHADKQLGLSSHLAAGLNYSDDDYQPPVLRHEKRHGVSLSYDYTVNSRWSMRLASAYTLTNADDGSVSTRYRDLETDATLRYAMSHKVDVNFKLASFRRRSDGNSSGVAVGGSFAPGSGVSIESYTDNVASIEIMTRF